ncbi:type I restriction endonuclease subunit R [Gephyromycinifex aptenodytis]|uniref:type I restriction endonuclease subunit R n=1 Tax=Gephyromycinifex aptenodytis TaxID=2716227 RepID=UPI0014474D13|nr:DEAD/DEAH box helicase family protein [Gephyromycinifex aptenodytis]
MGITKEAAFETNIESHLLENGWHAIEPASYDRRLGLFPDEVIAFVQASQPKAWQQLVARHGGEALASDLFVKAVARAIDHRGTIAVLRDLVKDSGVPVKLCYFKPASRHNEDQLQRYGANRCAVVRQLHHSESRPLDSLDMTLVVNGIPVATAELKNPLTNQNVEDAQRQYREDRNPNDLIFRSRTLVHFAVDPHLVFMTTRLAKQDTVFLPFNQGTAGAGRKGAAGNPAVADGYQTSYLWEQVWQRDNWLNLLGNFVHQSNKGILFPRFHQWHAVQSILQATYRDGAGTNRLIQHSAGSGKSNTIAWTAHCLSRLHGPDDQPVFDKVVVITDRRVLDKQLQDTVAGLDHTPGTIVRIDKHSTQLKEALEGNAARIIITTLQKFPVVLEKIHQGEAEGERAQVVGSRFAVIVDEAHSSTSGDSVKQLKTVLSLEDALADAEHSQTQAEEASDASDLLLLSAAARGKRKNLSFFAFTATPKPKTLELFGELGPDGHRHPFHIYSMRQAIDEGFILDVLQNYTTYSVYYKLANAETATDIEVDTHKGRAALARFASLHPYQLDAKAEVIVEHFRQKSAGKINGRAKAMVVTRSRLHAVRTKFAIDNYITKMGYDQGNRPLRALVAFSGEVVDPDLPQKSWTEAELNGFPEGQLPKKFHSDDYQVLVVAEKYQTGFDEPLLHTMYVDKKLSGVAAVQTLSRLNRTAPGKQDTFVLDFANTTEEIKEAFSDFYEESFATPTDPNVLYAMSTELMSAGVLSLPEMDATVNALLSDDPARQAELYANIQPAEGRFLTLEEETQESFRTTLHHFVRAYAFLAQVMPWTDADLERLFLYGKLLLLRLPTAEGEPLPQLSEAVQLTHLRLAVTDEGSIALESSDEPGTALPGEGKGSAQEPVLDRLSAIIKVMNERYGADLNDADKVWIDQQRAGVLQDQDMRTVAQNNDRAQYRMVLEERAGDLVLGRHDSNSALVDLFFANPDFKNSMVEYLMDTYDHFNRADSQ